MKATRRLCFDPVRCVVTVDLGAEQDVAVLAVNETASHLIRQRNSLTTRYEAVHGSVLLLGPVMSTEWRQSAAVLIDMPDEQIRGEGVVTSTLLHNGQRVFSMNVRSDLGEELALQLHCETSGAYPSVVRTSVDVVGARS